jgi:hypothetical protein
MVTVLSLLLFASTVAIYSVDFNFVIPVFFICILIVFLLVCGSLDTETFQLMSFFVTWIIFSCFLDQVNSANGTVFLISLFGIFGINRYIDRFNEVKESYFFSLNKLKNEWVSVSYFVYYKLRKLQSTFLLAYSYFKNNKTFVIFTAVVYFGVLFLNKKYSIGSIAVSFVGFSLIIMFVAFILAGAFFLLHLHKDRKILAFTKAQSKISRSEIEQAYRSLKLPRSKLLLVKDLAERRDIAIYGGWSIGFATRITADVALTELAKLEERWLGLDR